MKSLKGKSIAILSEDGFEEVELTSPKNALEKAGATVHIVSTKSGTIKSWNDGNWNIDVTVDKTLDEVSSKDYNGLMLPGGVINPDKLRRSKDAIAFVKSFFEEG